VLLLVAGFVLNPGQLFEQELVRAFPQLGTKPRLLLVLGADVG
jgi:hypothetical protein